MTKDELVEKCARALAHSHGLDFDEVCGVDADPDHGYCDSGTCIASGYEEHDAAYARACYLSDARAALAIAMPAAFEMAAKVADKRAEDRFADYGTTEWDTNASYYSGRRGEALDELDEEDWDIAKAIRELGEKWK
jgi:hypothetical protein